MEMEDCVDNSKKMVEGKLKWADTIHIIIIIIVGSCIALMSVIRDTPGAMRQGDLCGQVIKVNDYNKPRICYR